MAKMDITLEDDDDDDVSNLKSTFSLLVGEKVEVRSVNEGLMGSWHSGVVIECKNGSRKVKYDNVLCNDNSQILIDRVTVHPVLDGVTLVGRKRLNYRGFIRPSPPPLDLERFSLHYGQCVDAYYEEAWWEGVIFNRENSDVRSIFFPDLGDVLQIGFDVLRITQDWDEYTREWKPRGTWYFLELIGNHEQEDLLPVSIRQIWYEVREKKAFINSLKEWTNSHTKGCSLENLVKEVIDDHSNLAAEKYYGDVVESILSINNHAEGVSSHIYPCVSKRSAKENSMGQNICEFSKAEICCDSANETRRGGERLNKRIISHSDTTNEETLFGVPSLVPCKASSAGEHFRSKELSVNSEKVHSKKNTKRKWEIAGSDLVPVAEFCPGSVVEYHNCLSSNRRTSSMAKLNMRKHLAYLGWKVEICKADGTPRLRYTSPNGKSYMSLATVCKDWDFSIELENTPVSHPNDIVEPPNFPETDLPIGTNNALNTFNSLSTTCEAYAVGEVGSNANVAILSEPRLNTKNGDEANSKLTACEFSPSKVSIDLAKFGQLNSLVKEEHQLKKIHGFGDDIGAEVSDVGLVTAEEKIYVDIELSKSNTEEHGKKLDISLSTDLNSATNVEEFPGALLKNDSNIFKLQGSNVINNDFCTPVSEELAQKNNYFGSQISQGHNFDIFPEAETCRDSIYKLQMEQGDKMDLLISSNSQISDDETPLKKRKKCNWEIAGRDMVPKAEFCPNSVSEYLKVSSIKKGKSLSSFALNVRKHLSYLGWKIENFRDVGFTRMRYTSPDGKSYNSIFTVCKDLDTNTDQGEEKKVCVPHDIAEPAYLAETVKKYALLGSGENNRNTALPRISEADDMENGANEDLMAFEPLIRRNETLKTINFLATTGDVNSSGNITIILDQEKNIEIPDEANGKLIATANFPSRISIDHAEFGQVNPMLLEHFEDIQDKGNNTTTWFRNEHFEDIQDKGNRPNNSVITACEGYADGKINGGVKVPLVSEPNQNTIAGDKSISKLVNIQTSPTNLPMKVVETEKEISLSVENHHNDSAFSIHSSRSLLSLLIDNNVVLPWAKVQYRKKTGFAVKEGQITREGIICNCCRTVFGLSKFEVHSGSTYHRPAANLFLEDGRSLSECQLQLKCRDNLISISTPPPQLKRNRDSIKNIPKSCDKKKKPVTPSPQLKRGRRITTNDYLCSVCNLEGVAILCHHCPSSFHRACLDMKDIPEGEWFCPSCCCGICENNKFINGAKKIMEGSVLNCYQCERQYHVGCLLKQGDTDLGEGSLEKWFCNRKCKQISVGLRKLSGRPIVVGDDNLTWTLLKYTPQDDDMEGDEMSRVEILNSLRNAVSVMHECFDPVKEPRTKIDIINDVIFSKGSTVQRLNFRGFYTVLLSRDDDLISVAALRVHGEKVAEVPVIGTRFEYQRGGMCRLLMNVLEKKLLELGVERLVFLATPNVLSTWTTSFGFSRISESERRNLLRYTFLDFQGTAMCHKLLTKSAQPMRTEQNLNGSADGSGSADGNKNGVSAEVIQAEETEVKILHQGTADVALSSGRINGGIGTSPLILRV